MSAIGGGLFIPRRGFLQLLSAFLLQRLLLPDRVVLWLRPFALEPPPFNIAIPIHTSVVPFARLVGVAHLERPDEQWAVIEKKTKNWEAAERLISRIHKKSTRLKVGTLVKCSNVEWQKIVSYWMDTATLIIVDASNIGPGLEWEIGQLCERFDSDRVIFCVAESESNCVDPALDNLIKLLGGWYPNRRRIVRYPRVPSETNETTGRLVVQITECLALQQLNPLKRKLIVPTG